MSQTLFSSRFKLKPGKLAHLLLLSIIILLLPLDVFFLYSMKYFNKTFPNIYINSVKIGGLTKKTAVQTLGKGDKPVKDLSLYSAKYQILFKPQTVNIRYNIPATVNEAYNLGREADFITNTKTRLALFATAKTLPLQIDYSDTLLDAYLASLSAQLNEPMIPPTIIIESQGKRTATVSAGRRGQTLDTQGLKDQILLSYTKQLDQPILIPLIPASSEISSSQLQKVNKLANSLLNKKMIFTQGESTWELQDEALINFLSVYDSFDNPKIASWSAQLASTINRPPENALFTFDGTRVTEFKPAKQGLTLNVDDTVNAIKTGIQDLANSNDITYIVNLKVLTAEPQVTIDKANKLGIRELIGKGESWFSHSIPGRIHNVELATSKFHGLLIPPGETFSFVKAVGDIDAAHGYQQAYVIQNGKTVLGDGGGVCQVSSTLFRAALNAGLGITERHAHAYRVSYYEENSEIGQDATIFAPSVDLKFVNDTPGYILIQAMVDTKNLYMKFELYGQKDGRAVELSKSRIWDQAPPPPDVYQDDPTLPNGVVKQVDFKAWGAKASFDWKVTKDNLTLHEQTFYSTYRPWAAVFLKGTKP